ncbi:MAG: hypothetical protein K9W43_01760 [Candidatus Thorarchaeota archaeon]|nr:hypothetical protein [Candidatus Thorarchaeota archaeon]
MNKEKALKRELTRLRKRQNASAIDFRRMRRLRKARAQFWLLQKRKGVSTAPEKEVSKKEKKKKKVKEPELEEITEPELERIDESEIDELYSLDDEDVVEEEEPEADKE